MKGNRGLRKNRLSGCYVSTRLVRRRPIWRASTVSRRRRCTWWKPKFGGMNVSKVSNCGGERRERQKLKKLLAEQKMLDAAALRELLVKKMVGPAAKREAVAHLQAELRYQSGGAAHIASADRKMIRYRSCRPPDECLGKIRCAACTQCSQGASAIAGCSCCYVNVASRPG